MAYRTINVPANSNVPAPPPQTWSNMKIHSSGHFHISGCAAAGPSMYEQARAVFGQFRALVEEAGGCMNDIMTMQIFCTNLDENTEIWRARREFFSGDFPCSTLIEVSRVGSPQSRPPMTIEINCSGYLNGSKAD